jgi:hypothetical protein
MYEESVGTVVHRGQYGIPESVCQLFSSRINLVKASRTRIDRIKTKT